MPSEIDDRDNTIAKIALFQTPRHLHAIGDILLLINILEGVFQTPRHLHAIGDLLATALEGVTAEFQTPRHLHAIGDEILEDDNMFDFDVSNP